MKNSRQKIIGYIQEKQIATVDELSKVFRVTPANIRHHLAILIEQGSVEVIGQQSVGSRGRPAQLYSTIKQIKQNNLDQLTNVLLLELLDNLSVDQKIALLRNIAQRLCSGFRYGKANPTLRLYSAVQFLNRMKYQVHWEAHIEFPRIMFGHCPYETIIDQNPELCQMDTYLLEYLLEIPTKQISKLVPTSRGLAQCIFRINIPTV